MAWRLAQSLATLRDEINARAPARAKESDGYVGNPSHAARASDHNPCTCCDVVCAADWTHDPEGGFDAERFAVWLRARIVADPPERRVRYVIWDRRICSGHGQPHPAGAWRAYRGTNPHTKHVHVSVRHGAEHYDHAAPWGWPPAGEEHPT